MKRVENFFKAKICTYNHNWMIKSCLVFLQHNNQFICIIELILDAACSLKNAIKHVGKLENS
jgi:hypothetical protein